MAESKVFSFSGKYCGGSCGRSELLDQLRDVIAELNRAYMNFNGALEPELIEACIYEINALQARYAYLLRAARDQGIKNVEVFRFPRQDEKTASS